MDANGQRFWLRADEDHWDLAGSDSAEFDPKRRRLRLASRARAFSSSPPPPAMATIRRLRQTRDAFGTRAYWDAEAHAILTDGAVDRKGALLPPEPIRVFPPSQTPVDFAFAQDGILYVALEILDSPNPRHEILLIDRRGRFPATAVAAPEFTPSRLASHPDGGVWMLDRERRQLAHLQGTPLSARAAMPYRETTFRPELENPFPPRLMGATQPRLLPEETTIALACSPMGRLALLTWMGTDYAQIHVTDAAHRWLAPRRLARGGLPFDLTWMDEDRIAAMTDWLSEALIFTPDQAGPSIEPLGDYFPLRNHDGAPFVHGIQTPVHYPVTVSPGTRPLHRLSLTERAAFGEIRARMIDSRQRGTLWHRLYVEAVIPPDCSFVIALGATDDPTAEPEFFDHRFGGPNDGEETSWTGDASNLSPAAAWVRQSSELPHHPGLLGGHSQPNRAGLFTVLIQRTGRTVRSLAGRYLHVRVRMTGNSRSTPEIAALRIYGDRLSYRDHYLPELFRETAFGGDADRPGPATPSDFLERFLGTFESILTPLEDRIAHAHLFTDPHSTPDDALDWLGSWVGVSFEPAFPVAQRRSWIAAAHRLHRTRGTLAGLQLALEIATGGRLERVWIDGRETEIATGGHVTGGEILVLEDFRLRRTFATILGANLTDDKDPLLPGLHVSSNSFVGDTLILGEEWRREFLALYRDAFSSNPLLQEYETRVVARVFDRLAHRVTVFVRQGVEPQDLGLIRRIVAEVCPAHLIVRVVTATYPFLAGLASLVDVDTYLTPKAPKRPVQLNQSRLGERDFLLQAATLDPRVRDGLRWQTTGNPVTTAAPVAVITGPSQVRVGETIELNAANSTAASGNTVTTYYWTWQPSEPS